MTASEKLNLLRSFNSPRGEPIPGFVIDSLFAALPQIVALVEAAETACDAQAALGGGYEETDAIFSALTALDEKLS